MKWENERARERKEVYVSKTEVKIHVNFSTLKCNNNGNDIWCFKQKTLIQNVIKTKKYL